MKILNLKSITALFAIFIGLSMILMWIMFYLTGSIPEIETRPLELALHLLAEFITAVLLIFAGLGLIKSISWGYSAYLLATGMLLYTLIMSPGYFLQTGDFFYLPMFAVFILLTLYFLRYVLLNREQFE